MIDRGLTLPKKVLSLSLGASVRWNNPDKLMIGLGGDGISVGLTDYVTYDVPSALEISILKTRSFELGVNPGVWISSETQGVKVSSFLECPARFRMSRFFRAGLVPSAHYSYSTKGRSLFDYGLEVEPFFQIADRFGFQLSGDMIAPINRKDILALGGGGSFNWHFARHWDAVLGCYRLFQQGQYLLAEKRNSAYLVFQSSW